MYSSGRVVGNDRTAAARWAAARSRRASRARPRVETPPRAKLVLVALDLLFLAVHEPDVVAEEQVQVLVAGARQLLFDGLELEQQVVAERADQRQARSSAPRNSSIRARRMENTEGCLLRSSSGNSAGRGFKPAREDARLRTRIPPSADGRRAPGASNSRDLRAALVQRAELHAAVVGDDLQRRAAWRRCPSASTARGIRIPRKDRSPRCWSRSRSRRHRPRRKLVCETVRVTSIPWGVV